MVLYLQEEFLIINKLPMPLIINKKCHYFSNIDNFTPKIFSFSYFPTLIR